MGFNSGFKGLSHGFSTNVTFLLTLSFSYDNHLSWKTGPHNFISYCSIKDVQENTALGWVIIKNSLALQPAVGFGLSNNTSTFFPIYHQLSPSSHSQHLKISFYFFSSSFAGSSSLYHPFQFFSEDLFGHPILLHSLQVTQPTYPVEWLLSTNLHSIYSQGKDVLVHAL